MIQWDTFLLFTSTNKFSKSVPKDTPNATIVEAQPVMENAKDESAKDYDSNSERECKELASEIYDLIRIIKDPEKPQTLEELNVVQEKGIVVRPISDSTYLVRIEFVPTVPHCSLATLIGLCLRVKLERNLSHKFKLDIVLQEGSHATELEINKQINDKERIAAAMENPNLCEVVESCVQEDD